MNRWAAVPSLVIASLPFLGSLLGAFVGSLVGSSVGFAQDEATALSVDELATLGLRLRSTNLDERMAAARAILQAGPASVATVRERLARIDRTRRAAPPNIFKIMDELITRRREHGPRAGESEEVDMLDVLLHAARNRLGTSIEESSEIIALLRALGAARTTDGVRALIDFASKEDRIFQMEIGRILVDLGDRSLPGLIEARRHADFRVRKWAVQTIERLGKTAPSDAVQVHDNAALAEILLAFGRIRDPEAMRIVLSFANSERVQVREAARQSTAMFGQAAVWALREAYENFTGDAASADWNWERTMRELWATYDRYRLTEVHRLLDEGIGHARARRYAEMAGAFDRALARQPTFDRRVEMIAGLFAYGEELLDAGRLDQAESVLRKANRLEPAATSIPAIDTPSGRRNATQTPAPAISGPTEYAPRVLARIRYLEGRRSERQGIADPSLFEEAIRLDPAFSPARAELRRVDARARARYLRASRVGIAVGIALASIATLLLLVGYRPFGRGTGPSGTEDPRANSAGEPPAA